MLEILTLMNKIERVSRRIDPDNFVAVPGIWAELDTDGSIKNITTDTPGKMNKLVIGNASANIYESHDVSVGRITTVESFGVRCKVDSEGFSGTIVAGEDLIVSTTSGTEGKLVGVTNEAEAAGDYEVVARVEEVNTTDGYIIYRTISPGTVAVYTAT